MLLLLSLEPREPSCAVLSPACRGDRAIVAQTAAGVISAFLDFFLIGGDDASDAALLALLSSPWPDGDS